MFIVIEGIDYAGKTTVEKKLRKMLEDNGYGVCTTREPGGHVVGEKVRAILVNTPMDKDVWGLLLAATRIEHGRYVIKPAIERGEVVVSSRYITSTYIYQPEAITWCKETTLNHPDIVEPDFLILCDVSPDQATHRKRKRASENPDGEDYMDDLWVPEWNAQRNRFLDMARKLGEYAFVLNTELSEETQDHQLKTTLRNLGLKIS